MCLHLRRLRPVLVSLFIALWNLFAHAQIETGFGLVPPPKRLKVVIRASLFALFLFGTVEDWCFGELY